MQKYYLFFLEQEVRISYFYKSDILCRFFHSFLTQPYRRDLQKQFRYITRLIEIDNLFHFIENEMPHQSSRLLNDLKKNKIESSASAQVEKRWVEVEFDSLQRAYTQFFQWLEQFDSCCFIIEKSGRNYGWLTTMKKHPLLS
ncbi:sporulation inhibitor of replication protein SirA [Paraliobacillus sp. JSM ZJ581]|uniref:sporulation inhibitor of replication protein SirA n=1 Tax=Paraliobacillus sp. JSM ZJ581 TaxID=3342118 RepID=UPI0035A84CF7